MAGCYGGTVWDLNVKCPSGGNAPDIVPYIFPFSPNASGNTLNTGIKVNTGDYVFFAIKGTTSLGFPTLPQGYTGNDEYSNFFYNGQTAFFAASPKGIPTPQGYNIFKKFANFNLGQTILSIEGQQYGANNYNLKNQHCSIPLQEFVANNYYFLETYGDYFIVDKGGTIMIEINQKDLYSCLGTFNIEIYVLSKKQHFSRNCYNKCPRTEPKSGKDSFGWEWDDGAQLDQSIAWLDDIIEECYHGKMEDYRGKGTRAENQGCQCVYDAKGNLFNTGTTLGSFDYGYIGGDAGVKRHLILDVFSHIAYSEKDTTKYDPTSFTY
jgi:hypothetical protein